MIIPEGQTLNRLAFQQGTRKKFSPKKTWKGHDLCHEQLSLRAIVSFRGCAAQYVRGTVLQERIRQICFLAEDSEARGRVRVLRFPNHPEKRRSACNSICLTITSAASHTVFPISLRNCVLFARLPGQIHYSKINRELKMFRMGTIYGIGAEYAECAL